MIDFTRWYVIVGLLLILLAYLRPRVKSLPLTSSILYLAIGWLLGMVGWLKFDVFRYAQWLERSTEVVVIVSLFAAGLKLRVPLMSRQWRLPVLLAFGSMAATAALVATFAVLALGAPWGAAILLGALLAPTDPVLASDVQVEHARDTANLRFTLTAEAGLNDGTAFPLVMLGLGLMGLHELGAGLWRWWLIDVVWSVCAALAIGAIVGSAIGHWVVRLRRNYRATIGLDEFLALGLISLTYGLALAAHCYGFIAVFAAGVALRRVERSLSPEHAPADVKALAGSAEELAVHAEHAPAYLAESILHFTEQTERIGEFALVLVVGALLAREPFSAQGALVAAFLFLLARPAAVLPAVLLPGVNRHDVALMSWLGVRGIGSLYYLFHAINHGVPEDLAEQGMQITLWVVAYSAVIHGLSATPLMRIYAKRVGEKAHEVGQN